MSSGVGISEAEIGEAQVEVLRQQVGALTDLAAQYLAASRKLGAELQNNQEALAAATESARFEKEASTSLARALDEKVQRISDLESALEQRPKDKA